MKNILSNHWPDIGLIIAISILVILFVQPWLPILSLKWLFWLHLPILMIHQFEEFRFPGGLKKWIIEVKFKSQEIDTQLLDETAVRVNLGGWATVTLFALSGLALPWLAFVVIFFSLNNAIFHIYYSISTLRYSPGTITSFLFYIPFVLFASYSGMKDEMITITQFIVTFIIGAAMHFLFLNVASSRYRT